MSLEMAFSGGTRRLVFHPRPLLVAPSGDGLFAPGSVIRRVYADSACILGAGTALLLQLAHPAVAQGVHEHSDYESRPLDRLFGTLYAANTVVFGSCRDADAVRVAMERVHSRVSGPGYRALDPELLAWVNATLLGTAVQFYERLIGRLAAGERDEFVRDARIVGEVFGCPVEAQPADWADFEAYWARMTATLVVDDTARRVARSLLAGQGLPLHPLWRPALHLTRAVTAATLPERIRDGYGLAWRPVDHAVAGVALSASGAVLRRLPPRWRQLGPELLRAPERPGGGEVAAA